MIVIADTSPFNYLVQIGEIDVLECLFARVLIPRAVYEELSQPHAPARVRSWIARSPAWLEIRESRGIADSRLARLGPGEREVILLAEELGADQLLLDDLAGRREARLRHFQVTGTLGVLKAAAKEGLLNFGEAVAQLRHTNFHISQDLLDKLLQDDNR
jgi:predicted nucleic acid-binding protein